MNIVLNAALLTFYPQCQQDKGLSRHFLSRESICYLFSGVEMVVSCVVSKYKAWGPATHTLCVLLLQSMWVELGYFEFPLKFYLQHEQALDTCYPRKRGWGALCMC